MVLLAARVPIASAEAPTIRVTASPQPAVFTLESGARGTGNLRVTVEFVDMACTSGAKLGVDHVVASGFVSWAGMDLHPDAATYAYPNQTRIVEVSVVVDEDAPAGASTTFEVQPVVHYPAAGDCTPSEPPVEAPPAKITVRTSAPSPTEGGTTGATDDGNGSPSPGAALAILAALGAWGLARRRIE